VDGWNFKQYVLGMLFYRYISENITAYINAGKQEAGRKDFDYAQTGRITSRRWRALKCVFYRGGAEQKIRQYLIENNFVDCVIQLSCASLLRS
jgi:type I restriction-modification system DNA methylase subunit